MPDSPSCHSCGQPLQPEDVFCARCGRPAGAVEWSFSTGRQPGAGVVMVRGDRPFYLVAVNGGTAAVRAGVDPAGTEGIRLVGSSQRRIGPGQTQAFEFYLEGEGEPRGDLTASAETGFRSDWWERRDWTESRFPLSQHLRLNAERWVVGTPALLFPPGVRTQYTHVWNDSGEPRACASLALGGALQLAGPAEGLAFPEIPAKGTLEIGLQLSPAGSLERSWVPLPETAPIPIVTLPAARPQPGADAVVAIDFGTRNTRIRVRWRRTLVPSKSSGTVDSIGDRAGSEQFPSQMVLHLQERTFRWGTEAAEYVAAGRLQADEIAVDNLKTYLREGQDPFISRRAEWTSEELLRRFLERIVHRLDQYFRTADAAQPLERASLDLRYVVCRPVLDANESDARGLRYEGVVRQGLIQAGVPAAAISFLQEPVAAAIGIARRREGELLSLPEGAAVAVVDSGGGTTDVALARVRLTEGRVTLDLAGSYPLTMAPDNPAMSALRTLAQPDRLEIGGNVLDCALAYALLTDARKVLDTEGKAPPRSLWRGPLNTLTLTGLNEFIRICRRMKERFARASTQFLNRAAGAARDPAEVLPFPHRPELEGVYLVHGMYDDAVAAPILRPAVEQLAGTIHSHLSAREGETLRVSDVCRVFYVGGTNIDPFVRLHFGRAFPLAPAESDPDAQSARRMDERLHAVVDGAVWSDERLFALAPVTLTLRLAGEEKGVVAEGTPLMPASVAAPRFFNTVLDPGQELDAALLASGGGLPAPIEVARALYRNDAPVAEDVTLSLRTSRELGVVAELQAGDRRSRQWRFALTET